jgi:hypothetical protein
LDWLTSPKKDGKLVLGGQLADELNNVATTRRFIRTLLQAGRARLIPTDTIEVEQNHVIATKMWRF